MHFTGTRSERATIGQELEQGAEQAEPGPEAHTQCVTQWAHVSRSGSYCVTQWVSASRSHLPTEEICAPREPRL